MRTGVKLTLLLRFRSHYGRDRADALRTAGTGTQPSGVARAAYEVQQATVSQPQLLAVLCLMRSEDWTFREAEVRLSEYAELRAALLLNSAPTTPLCFAF